MAIEAMQYWTSLQFRDELTSIIQTNLVSSVALVVHAKTTLKRANFSKGLMAYLKGMKGSGDNQTNLIW